MSAYPLEVKSVYKDFGSKKVLKNISFNVQAGETFGLVGVNGVGKTTLIKIILNLLEQDKGEVSFFGKDVSDKEARKKISYLPEKFYPSTLLKGLEFLSISQSFYGKELDVDLAKAKAKVLDLDPEALHNRVSKYSKGMGQKLGLLSMFLTECPMLLLDEPMSGLDPKARIQLKELLNDYRKKGNTIFFSSHILADIEEICDRMAVIHNGEIIFVGKPADFLKNYKEKNLERAFLKAIA